MAHSSLGSFPSCLMALSLILHFKPGTSHVDHPKILFFFFLKFWQTAYLLISCCEVVFYGDAGESSEVGFF